VTYITTGPFSDVSRPRHTFHRKYRNQEQNKENLNGSINGRKVQRTTGQIIQEEKQSGQHQEKRQKHPRNGRCKIGL